MKRRKMMLGASLVGIAAAATLGLTAAAVAAVDQHPAPPAAQAPKVLPKTGAKGKRSPGSSVPAEDNAASGREAGGRHRVAQAPAVNVEAGTQGQSPRCRCRAVRDGAEPAHLERAPPLHKSGVTGYEQATWGGYSLEPSDPEICAGNGYIMQVVNNDHRGLRRATATSFRSPIPAEYFFSNFFDAIFDPKCYWDPDTQHFFISWAVADFNFGAFSGVYIAVSVTANPLGPWNIYMLDTTDPFGNNGCFDDTGVACLGDQPLLGADKWTLQISTNEFPLVGGFNGALYFLIDKTALALGLRNSERRRLQPRGHGRRPTARARPIAPDRRAGTRCSRPSPRTRTT